MTKRAKPRTPDRESNSLCSDCPSVGVKVDPTRCLKCPFRIFEAFAAIITLTSKKGKPT